MSQGKAAITNRGKAYPVNLPGKTALVTGASSGIGRETALRLARAGCQVIAAARRLDRLQDLAKAQDGILPMTVDLADPAATQVFCQSIQGLNRPVDILVNNAGYAVRGAIEDVPMEAIRRVLEVNLLSLIQVTRACLPGMRSQRGGVIVNLSSVVGKMAFPISGIYAATKHAVEAVSDALRLELRPLGIHVIAIRPGAIGTEFQDAAARASDDPASRTHPDYLPIYETVGASMSKLFQDPNLPGPALIADLIMAALSEDDPKPAYTAGPMSDDVLAARFAMDDEAFDRFWSQRVGLADLKV